MSYQPDGSSNGYYAQLNDRTERARDAENRPESRLTEPTPEVIENILWPVPIFERLREQQRVVTDDIEIRPGDVLETLDKCHCEALLVVSVLPNAVAQNPVTTNDARPHLLTYSDEFQTFRVLNAAYLYAAPDQENTLLGGDGTVGYYVHKNVADMVSPSQTNRADRTHRGLTETAPPVIDLQDQYPESIERTITAGIEDTDSKQSIDTFVREITQGDAREVLPEYPSNSVHTWITSPPYYQQRDFGHSKQLGRERTPGRYLQHLLAVINELMRVLRDDGLGWLIIDDTRFNGALEGIPQRLHTELENQGYNIIHNAPWVKPNPKPDPAPNRYAHAHETVICIANSTDYFFHREGIEDPTDVFEVPVGGTNTSHDAVFPVALPKQILKASHPENVCPSCGTPHTPEYSVTDIRNLPPDRPQAQRALNLADKHDLTDAHLEALRAVGLGDTGQSARTQNGTGKNKDDVEALAEEARDVLGSYSREFVSPEKSLTGWETACDCGSSQSTTGICLDPFAGVGTTLLACRDLQYRWSGIELSADYIAEAEQRIGTSVTEPSRLRDESQEGLQSWT